MTPSCSLCITSAKFHEYIQYGLEDVGYELHYMDFRQGDLMKKDN